MIRPIHRVDYQRQTWVRTREVNMSIYYGIVRGNVVVLPEHVHLAEGSVVEVHAPTADIGPAQRASPLEVVQEELQKAGLLLELKRPPAESPEGLDRTPIRVTGKPASEIIVEERR
jgi:hypothetical protein